MTLIPLFNFVHAQNYSSWSTHVLAGKVYKHTKKINLPGPLYTQAIELSYKKQTQGKQRWEQRFGFPETALNVLLSNNGNSKLGYTIGVYPSIQFRLITRKTFYWYWKFGGGVGLVTKYWKRLPPEDSLNNIIGGLVNNVSMFQNGIRLQIKPKWTSDIGFHFYHASNASARQPNFGINTYGLYLGLNYHPQGTLHQFKKVPDEKRSNPLNIGLRLSYAMAEDKMPNGPMYPYYNISVFAQKRYRGKSQILLGADMTYNTRFYAIFKNNGLFLNEERKHAWRPSFFLGHEFGFGKIGFNTQLGFYTSRPLGGPLAYQKLGLNYHFFHNESILIKDIFLHTHLKTHLAQAELAEVGFGFYF